MHLIGQQTAPTDLPDPAFEAILQVLASLTSQDERIKFVDALGLPMREKVVAYRKAQKASEEEATRQRQADLRDLF